MGIIAVLAAVLVPICVSAKKSATRGECQLNLAQIARAFQAYLADNSGCYPCIADLPGTAADESDPALWMGRHWRWPMSKYLVFGASFDPSDPAGANQITGRTNSVLRCPSDPNPTQQYDKTSYAYSFAFYHTPEQMQRMTRANTLAASEPDLTLRPVVVNSGTVAHPARKVLVAEWLSAHSDAVVNWWSWGGSRSYLFVDGHVKYLAASRIHPSVDNFPDINLTRGGVAGRDLD